MKLFSKIIIGVVLFLLFVVVVMFQAQNSLDKACMEAGLDHIKITKEFYYCVDVDGNLHYVEWGYKKFPFERWVKEISVGDVRVVNS